MDPRLKRYVGIVEFLGKALGKHAEVVLHDVTDVEKSVIAIENNHISNRGIGAPATDLVLSILKNDKHEKRDYYYNYKSTSPTGKPLKAATYIIRDDFGKIIGMLCINMDIEFALKARNYLDSFINFDQNITENLTKTVNEITLESIYKEINKYKIPASRLSKHEKMEIVESLYNKGIFYMKGAVNELAISLEVSEATAYRYIGEVKSKLEKEETKTI